MQKRRNVKTKIVASLITFMMFFTNFATLGSALVSYAADDSSDAINYAVQFVEITENTDDYEESPEPNSEVSVPNVSESEESSENEENDNTTNVEIEGEDATEIDSSNEQEFGSFGMMMGSSSDEAETDEVKMLTKEDRVEKELQDKNVKPYEESENETSAEIRNEIPTKLYEGYAIEITVGVKESGYLKNAKVEIKDLANQMFTIRNNVEFGEYIQSIDGNKIKLKQINGGTEVKVYIPIDLKQEESIDVGKLQTGTTFNLTVTYVTAEGIEEVITKSESPKLLLKNTSNLVVDSNFEKVIPYVKENERYALAQIKVIAGSTNTVNLPVMDSTVEVDIPVIDNANIQDVNVAAISTAYTNGLANGDVQFTVENWRYEDGKVIINVNNTPRDGRYFISNGNDEYVITFTYSNYPENGPGILKGNARAKANVFFSDGTQELNNEISKEYDLSQANSNIITYEVAGNTQEFSKGYLYGNLNTDNPEYSIEFDNNLNVNISRVDLLNIVEIREADEYFEDVRGNRYGTTTRDGANSYYKSVKLNRANLRSIIGENGSFELLNENAEQLIEINKDTPDDGDGNITIGFEGYRIDKILFRINNPEGDGILNITATKRIDRTTYDKVQLMQFTKLKADYVAAAALEGDIITDMGSTQVEINLLNTISNATVSLSRKDLSTLVENEDVEISINLNNAEEISDMYNNPVFELTFPKEIKEVSINDINVLYGNGELNLGNVETTINNAGQVVLKVSLVGAQTKYAFGDSNVGTTIMMKTNLKVDMYKASSNSELLLRYYNEDATNYADSEAWAMESEITDKTILAESGKSSTELNIVAPEGLVNAQFMSGYNGDRTLISVNQGLKEDSIETFTEEPVNAQMKLITINNTGEDLSDVKILGRTIFDGNTSIVRNQLLGTNANAPMTSEIEEDVGNLYSNTIYYSENGQATDSLEDKNNGWTTTPTDIRKVKSYLIVLDGVLPKGGVLNYKYNFEIPAQLSNEVDLAATFATYFSGEVANGVEEADKIMLSTGEAPILDIEIEPDIDIDAAVEGQHIKYTVKVTNMGTTTARNVNVVAAVPENTVYVAEDGYEDEEQKEVTFVIDEVRPGNTEERQFEVVVTNEVPEDTTIEPEVKVDADGLENLIETKPNEAMLLKKASADIKISSNTDDRIYQPGRIFEFSTLIGNKLDTPLHNVVVEQVIPENVEIESASVEGPQESDSSVTINNEAGIITYRINELQTYRSLKLKVKVSDMTEYHKTIFTSATMKADELNEEYKSNEIKMNLGKANLEIRSYSSKDNKYLKEGEQVKYILSIANIGDVDAVNVNVKNAIPNDFYVTNFEGVVGDTTVTALASNSLNMNLSIPAGQVAEIVASCTAKNLENSIDEKMITNSWRVTGNNINNTQTGNFENIVQQNKELSDKEIKPTTDYKVLKEEDVYVPTNIGRVTLNEAEETYTMAEEKQDTYRIIGRAFNDLNKNGQRDDEEDGMENIVAKLCDAKSQQIVSQVVTNKAGDYVFDEVVPGEYYVKFEYDTDKYALTDYKKSGVTSEKNSDAVSSNYKAVTDKITIKDGSVSDIDIGLYRSGIFDLDLDVNINQVTVQNPEETLNLTMENPKLAKYDVKPQYTTDTTIYVEYTIEVSNKGEIPGFAKKIVDYIPDGLELETDMNSNWYIGSDGKAYNNELENTEIKPGETKEIKLILTKHMTENGTGIYNNVFEIAQTYNEYAIEDIDSTPGNNVQGEDDLARADIIIGIQTGGSVVNVMIISTTLITLLVALYAIKIYVDKKNKEVIV